MPELPSGNGNHALGIAIYAALMFDVISEACSSPQTAEINIGAREETLMKWVTLGLATGGVFVLVGMAASPRGRRWEPLLGGGLAGLIIWIQYAHARKSGLEAASKGAPGTEQYG